MDELSEDQLCELEEQLYGQIHHEAATQSTFSVASESQMNESHSEKTKFLSNRYWAKTGDKSNKTPQNPKEKFQKSATHKNDVQKPNDDVQSKVENYSTAKDKSKNKKWRNPFASPAKQSKQHSKGKNAQCENFSFNGRIENKLQRAMQYENKKQKSRNARTAMEKRQKTTTETVVLLSSDENSSDEVVIVPLPPVPVYNIDDSDDDEKGKNAEKDEDPLNTVANEEVGDDVSHCSSQNSNLLQDDFISQSDRQRLLESSVFLDDADLPISAKNIESLLQPSTPPSSSGSRKPVEDDSNDIECLGTLIKTNATAHGGNGSNQSYRVDQSVFRAMDVYETDSDSASGGVYSKGVTKAQNTTTTREIDNSSDGEEPSTSMQAKAKLLRKRRASGNAGNSDLDGEDDGVESTGIPFISRGPALEVCKSKRIRIRSNSKSGMSDSQFMATLKGLAQGKTIDYHEDSSDDDSEAEVYPTARDIAEKVLNQQRTAVTSTPKNRVEQLEEHRTQTTKADKNSTPARNILDNSNEAIPEEIADNIERLFEGNQITEAHKNSTAVGNILDNSSEAVPEEIADNIERLFEGNQITEADQNSTAVGDILDDSNEAVPEAIADDIERLFDKINEMAAKVPIEIDDDDDDDCEDSDVSHIYPVTDVSAAVSERSFADRQTEATDADSKIKYYIAYLPASNSCITDGFGWDEEMRRFYNHSWGGENAREEEILRHMTRDRRLWSISDADRGAFGRNRRERKEKCINCYSFGHTRAKCPKPKKPITCFMCGESGHQEPRCPNARCLRCGSKTSFFCQSCRKCMYWNNRICPICKLRGHSLNDCPDKWRRYHSTTRPNVYPNSRVIYNKRRYCCFCGRRGHLSDDCKKAMCNRSEYPMISSEIKSHEKSYDDVMRSGRQHQIPCRLLFDPNAKYDFGLAAKTKHTNMYGRFLCSVGLGHLIGTRNEVAKSSTDLQAINIKTENIESSCTINSPEQVPEVSEGSNDISAKVIAATESLQMPPPREPGQNTLDTKNEPIDQDSDSNYSFSDHFEIPASPIKSAKTAPLPDFISMNDTAARPSSSKFRISARYAECYSDDESFAVHEKPCEAKIYISNEHSQYFQSNAGQEYLNKIMLENNLRGRLNKTIVGCALFIHGLPSNQKKIQRELQLKFKSLSEAKTQRSSKMPLPDFISINDTTSQPTDEFDKTNGRSKSMGISARYAECDSDDESSAVHTNLDIPCDAKIYISNEYSQYFQSNAGQEYLNKIMLENNLKGQLNKTIVGYALFIHGLPSNQGKIQRELQLKFKSLCEAKSQVSSKVPRNVSVLIRRLRSGIIQLYSNLGNASDLYKRLDELDKQNSKGSIKLADRMRRLLNMIFLGQAGLLNGDKHIETLLRGLQTLINDFKGSDVTPENLRNEIDNSWRQLFTPFNHKSYSQLLSTYLKMSPNSRNRILQLEIEPSILGRPKFSLKINDEQKTSYSNEYNRECNTTTSNTEIIEGALLLNVIAAEKQSEIQMDLKTEPESEESNTAEEDKPTTTNSEKFNSKHCQELLSEIALPIKSDKKGRNPVVNDSSKPSMFWSRESQKYLQELIDSASNKSSTLERLQHINKKATAGGLSYNDYRSVIELYNVTKRISKK